MFAFWKACMKRTSPKVFCLAAYHVVLCCPLQTSSSNYNPKPVRVPSQTGRSKQRLALNRDYRRLSRLGEVGVDLWTRGQIRPLSPLPFRPLSLWYIFNKHDTFLHMITCVQFIITGLDTYALTCSNCEPFQPPHGSCWSWNPSHLALVF